MRNGYANRRLALVFGAIALLMVVLAPGGGCRHGEAAAGTRERWRGHSLMRYSRHALRAGRDSSGPLQPGRRVVSRSSLGSHGLGVLKVVHAGAVRRLALGTGVNRRTLFVPAGRGPVRLSVVLRAADRTGNHARPRPGPLPFDVASPPVSGVLATADLSGGRVRLIAPPGAFATPPTIRITETTSLRPDAERVGPTDRGDLLGSALPARNAGGCRCPVRASHDEHPSGRVVGRGLG